MNDQVGFEQKVEMEESMVRRQESIGIGKWLTGIGE